MYIYARYLVLDKLYHYISGMKGVCHAHEGVVSWTPNTVTKMYRSRSHRPKRCSSACFHEVKRFSFERK